MKINVYRLRRNSANTLTGREGILVDYFDILHEENEDKLVILLLSKLPNLRTMWMVMPEVSFEWSYPDNAFCQFLENTSDLATSGVLQKLETLYICSPMRKFVLSAQKNNLSCLHSKFRSWRQRSSRI